MAKSASLDAAERRKWCKEERRVRRRWKAHGQRSSAATFAGRRKAHALSLLLCGGVWSCDRRLWSEELRRHCLQTYYDASESDAAQARRRGYLEHLQRHEELDGVVAPAWALGATMAARARSKSATSAGGGDNLVAEIFKTLPWLACLSVRQCFKRRYAGHLQGTPCSWKRIVMIFIAKVRRPQSMEGVRGIR